MEAGTSEPGSKQRTLKAQPISFIAAVETSWAIRHGGHIASHDPHGIPTDESPIVLLLHKGTLEAARGWQL